MNKATIIGRLFKGGVTFNENSKNGTECRFKLEVTEYWKEKEYKEIVNVYASGNDACAMEAAQIGDLVLVSGMAKTGKYEQNGGTIYYLEIKSRKLNIIEESLEFTQDDLDRNEVILVGRLGSDPKIFKEGEVTTFSIACDDYDGKQETTQWLNVTTFKGMAKAAGKYLKKGRLVAVEGNIRTGEYKKDNQIKKATSIVAKKWKALDSNPKKREKVGNSEPANYQSADNDIPF